MLKAIHAQETLETAREKAQAVAQKLRDMWLNGAAKKVEERIEETLAYYEINPKSCVNKSTVQSRAKLRVASAGSSADVLFTG